MRTELKNLLVVAALTPFAAGAETLVAVSPNISGGTNLIFHGASECATGLRFEGHSPGNPSMSGCVLMIDEKDDEITVLFKDSFIASIPLDDFEFIGENDYEHRHKRVL